MTKYGRKSAKYLDIVNKICTEYNLYTRFSKDLLKSLLKSLKKPHNPYKTSTAAFFGRND
jgi:hypothetical protein